MPRPAASVTPHIFWAGLGRHGIGDRRRVGARAWSSSDFVRISDPEVAPAADRNYGRRFAFARFSRSSAAVCRTTYAGRSRSRRQDSLSGPALTVSKPSAS